MIKTLKSPKKKRYALNWTSFFLSGRGVHMQTNKGTFNAIAVREFHGKIQMLLITSIGQSYLYDTTSETFTLHVVSATDSWVEILPLTLSISKDGTVLASFKNLKGKSTRSSKTTHTRRKSTTTKKH